MKKFSINCDFGGQMAPFTFFIGKPEHGHHALHFQADWLSKQRGGVVPSDVMEAISQLQELAEKNGVSLEELCVYALGTKADQEALEKESMEENYHQEDEPEEESLKDEHSDEESELDAYIEDSVETEIEDGTEIAEESKEEDLPKSRTKKSKKKDK